MNKQLTKALERQIRRKAILSSLERNGNVIGVKFTLRVKADIEEVWCSFPMYEQNAELVPSPNSEKDYPC